VYEYRPFNISHLNAFQDNILISDDGVAQINDFAHARILSMDGFDEPYGTNVRYMAPELGPIAQNEEGPAVVTPTTASDIYSLGILLLQVRLYMFHLSVEHIMMLYLLAAVSWT
jgi:serine/threonine protein kinase